MLKWILWALLAILLLLFFCRTRIELLYLDGTMTARMRLLYIFRINLYPIKEKAPKEKKPEKKKPKPEKPPPEKKPKQKSEIPVMDYIQTMNDILPILGRSIGYWMRHTRIDRLWVRTVVHQEDAADTAIRCGQLSAAAQTLYAWCTPRMRIRNFSFSAVPSFADEAEPLNVCLHVSASPAGMLWGLVLFLCRGGVALWRGPLVSQLLKKQPVADKKNRRKPHTKTIDKQIKDGVA